MRKLVNYVALTSVALMIAGPAAAAVMNFDDLNGNPAVYTDQNFSFSPANANSSSMCYSGSCIHEADQGLVSTMTYNASPADQQNDPFNLDFFYFSLQGKVTKNALNSFVVTGTKSGGGTVSATLTLGDAFGPIATGASLSLAKQHGGGAAPTTLTKQDGFWVDLNNEWNGLTSVSWVAQWGGQMRLDCVGANETRTGAQSGCSSEPSAVPLPAGAVLLLTALGGLGFARKRKS